MFALFSPPGTPAYNGSVEAGIGSLEVRAFYESARHDRPGEWTCDDVAAACLQANETAHPWGLGGPTPELSWRGRAAITEIDAHEFRSAYDHEKRTRIRRAADPSGATPVTLAPGVHRPRRPQPSLDRTRLSTHPKQARYSTDYAQISGTNIMRGTLSTLPKFGLELDDKSVK